MKRALFILSMAGLLLGLAALSEPEASPSRKDLAQSQLRDLRQSIFLYRARYGRWPTSLAHLATTDVGILEKVRPDPWGNDFLWLRPGRTDSAGCLLSVGRDGRPGTADDVTEVCDREILNQHLVLRAGLDDAEERRDAYGRLIRLIERDGHRLVWSYGPDGVPDTDDDVMGRVRSR